MSAVQCGECGKFRRSSDVARSDHGDEFEEMKTECRWCMSLYDRILFNLPLDTDPESARL